MRDSIFIAVILLAILFCCSCLQPMPTDNSNFTNPPIFGPEWLDAMLEVAQAMSFANFASTPVNPYMLPVSIGLAGLTAMLEALRRKEKSGRKHAEGKLNNGNGPK